MFTARLTHPSREEIGLIPVTQVRARYPERLTSTSPVSAPGFPLRVDLVRADGHNCTIDSGTVEIFNASGTLVETFYPNSNLPQTMPTD